MNRRLLWSHSRFSEGAALGRFPSIATVRFSATVIAVLAAALGAANDRADIILASSKRDEAGRCAVARIQSEEYKGSQLAITSSIQIAYDRQGSFREDVKYKSGRTAGSSLSLVKVAEAMYVIMEDGKGGKSAVFPSDAKPLPVNFRVTETVVPKPCFGLGLGLSGPGVIVDAHAGKLSLKGPTEQGLTFRADVLPGSCAPISVDILNGDKLFSRWTYRWAAGSPAGTKLAESRFDSDWAKIHKTFRIQYLEFRRPTSDELDAPWFVKGCQVEDDRVGMPIVWTYEDLLAANHGDSSMSPQRLYELSRQRAGLQRDYQSGHARQSRRQRQSGKFERVSADLAAGLALVGVAAAGMFAFRRNRKPV